MSWNRKFSEADLQKFARLSGDWNPLHVDAVKARRLLYGRPVVHGICLLSWALDCWLEGGESQVGCKQLKATFQNPLFVGAEVCCSVSIDGDKVVITASSGGKKVLSAKVVVGDKGEGNKDVLSKLPPHQNCLLGPEGMVAKEGGQFPLYANMSWLEELFPNIARALPISQTAFLLASTFVVGMECPGQHSLYSGLSVVFEENPCEPEVVEYQVKDFNNTFSRAVISMKTVSAHGELVAFVRPAPTEQLEFSKAIELVDESEFSDSCVLIVGGGRGLGETCAKILAAGGCHVVITYRNGIEDAQAVAEEINSQGGLCEVVQWSAGSDSSALRRFLDATTPESLFYFASPHIGVGAKEGFDHQRFTNFTQIYIEGLNEVVDLVTRASSRAIGVYSPSTVFIETSPTGFQEYVAAKIAMESFCGFLERRKDVAMASCPRLQRLATDQTASLSEERAPEPHDVMLEHVRKFFGLLRQTG